jgi:rhodanese-related sulfurtransferase
LESQTIIPAISVQDLASWLTGNAAPFVLDVREPWEVAICRLDGARTIPMNALPDRLDGLPGDRPIVVVCHHGQRSALVTQYLLARGFDQAVNLAGGIDRWAVEVDPSMSRY